MIPTLRLPPSSLPRCSLRSATTRGELLLVRRCDSGTWELPGGRVDVGESAVEAALRETSEESGLRVRITGLVGLFTDPACVVESATGDEVRQQFVVCFHGRASGAGRVRTCTRPVTPPGSIPRTSRRCRWQPAARLLIVHALSGADEPHLG